MPKGEYVTVENVQIGADTSSGLAYWIVDSDGNDHCIPYSQTRARHRNRSVLNGDSIEITRWIAEQKEIGFKG